MTLQNLLKMLHRPLALSLIVLFLFSLMIGCQKTEDKNGGKSSGRATIVGSTTLLPIIQAASEEYAKGRKQAKVDVQGGGSSVGIESIINGTAAIGMTSREPTDEEMAEGLFKTPVAVDAIAIIVNPDNPVDNLTSEQARKIFSGEVSNWLAVGGKDEDIILVNRDEASGTREAFSKLLMGDEDFLKKAIIQPGSGQVRSVVGGTPAAIGYLSRGYVNREVKVVGLDGVRPSIATIKKGSYSLSRTLYLVTKGEPEGSAKDFIDFVLSPVVQHEIVGTAYEPIIEVKK
jgi:phosphate transport system substrate-binding protein